MACPEHPSFSLPVLGYIMKRTCPLPMEYCTIISMIAVCCGVSFAQDEPILPVTPINYSDTSDLPAHYTNPQFPGSAATSDNETVDNLVTDAGATLGRVLFYDKRLSVNDSVACASCHQQEHGFSDPDVIKRKYLVQFSSSTCSRRYGMS